METVTCELRQIADSRRAAHDGFLICEIRFSEMPRQCYGHCHGTALGGDRPKQKSS